MSGKCIFELQNIHGTVIYHGSSAYSSMGRNELDQTGRRAIKNTKKHAGRALERRICRYGGPRKYSIMEE